MRGDACFYRHINQEKEPAPLATNRQSSQGKDEQNPPRRDEKQEENFPEDQRKVDQTSAALIQLITSKVFKDILKVEIESIIRGKAIKI